VTHNAVSRKPTWTTVGGGDPPTDEAVVALAELLLAMADEELKANTTAGEPALSEHYE